jgi:hypothetical protein
VFYLIKYVRAQLNLAILFREAKNIEKSYTIWVCGFSCFAQKEYVSRKFAFLEGSSGILNAQKCMELLGCLRLNNMAQGRQILKETF